VFMEVLVKERSTTKVAKGLYGSGVWLVMLLCDFEGGYCGLVVMGFTGLCQRGWWWH